MSRKFIEGPAYNTKQTEGGLLVPCEINEKEGPLATLPPPSDVIVGLFIPKEKEGETWHKVTLECGVNFLNIFLNNQHNFNSTKWDNPSLSVDGINPNLIILMHLLSDIQQYSINSNSWLSDTVKFYDLSKIESDLTIALNFVKSLQKSSQ
jgi:hypothetical protein